MLLLGYSLFYFYQDGMKSVEKKDKIQKIALTKWVENGKIGSCEIVTGLGEKN